jgi:two-component sensor histidine kinase
MLGEHGIDYDHPQSQAPSEEERLAALRRYGILDTPPEASFDRITALASRLLDVPIALVSIVDRDRIWFKSKFGLDVDQVPRDLGLCALTFERSCPTVIPDLLQDERYRGTALSEHPYRVRFYAGTPLVNGEGLKFGALCVMDHRPRQVDSDQVKILRELAAMTVDHIELRYSARRAVDRMAEALKQKAAALERAELLKQETDHRIMNSLQLVSSLLMLQSRSVENEVAARQLESAASRVAAVAGVHRHFYLDPSIDSLSGLDYLRQLCGGLSDMLKLETVRVQGSDFEISAKTIVPVGLMVNELVTNAAKHGGSEVDVLLEPFGENGFILSVEDNGEGFPKNLRPGQGKGLGMRVVRLLAQQIGGRVTFGTCRRGKGARVSVHVASACV